MCATNHSTFRTRAICAARPCRRTFLLRDAITAFACDTTVSAGYNSVDARYV